ncbi:hypothetical protein MKX03_024380 [Papaver bracteatum]|nr:hypothetical protein MKX03_024380 [Papaver bracteatum]
MCTALQFLYALLCFFTPIVKDCNLNIFKICRKVVSILVWNYELKAKDYGELDEECLETSFWEVSAIFE